VDSIIRRVCVSVCCNFVGAWFVRGGWVGVQGL